MRFRTSEIDRAIDELCELSDTELALALADTQPSVIVDPSMWSELDRPIRLRPRRMQTARGTMPPSTRYVAVYCAIEPETDGIPIYIDDDEP